MKESTPEASISSTAGFSRFPWKPHGRTKNKKHKETQQTENQKKTSLGLVSTIILEFFSFFCLIMVSTPLKLGHCWPKLLSHSAMPSASRGPSYSMGSPAESQQKLDIKIDWFQARIRKFRGKTVPGFRWFVCWTKKMSLFTLSRCWGIKAMIQDSNLPPPFTKYFNVGYDVT